MRLIFYGGGLQAKLNHSIVIGDGHTVPIVFDADPRVHPSWDCDVIRDEALLRSVATRCEGFVVCLGNERRGRERVRIARELERLGLVPVCAIHPTTYIGENVMIGRGLQTFPRAAIGAPTTIGDYGLLGMNAAVDHHCTIGDGVTIMNSAAVLGECHIGDFAAISPNATIAPKARIAPDGLVAAGAVVLP